MKKALFRKLVLKAFENKTGYDCVIRKNQVMAINFINDDKIFLADISNCSMHIKGNGSTIIKNNDDHVFIFGDVFGFNK